MFTLTSNVLRLCVCVCLCDSHIIPRDNGDLRQWEADDWMDSFRLWQASQVLNSALPFFLVVASIKAIMQFILSAFSVNSVGRDDGGNLSEEEAYPRGFGLIGELFSGTDASKNKKDRELWHKKRVLLFSSEIKMFGYAVFIETRNFLSIYIYPLCMMYVIRNHNTKKV